MVLKKEGRREKPQTPKPKTETPIPTPERKMGKREEDYTDIVAIRQMERV
jgi:hypothetical protein